MFYSQYLLVFETYSINVQTIPSELFKISNASICIPRSTLYTCSSLYVPGVVVGKPAELYNRLLEILLCQASRGGGRIALIVSARINNLLTAPLGIIGIQPNHGGNRLAI